MAKKVKTVIKLQIPAGKATPAPPVGPALGQHGVNIMAFCKDYNERTASQAGFVIPVEITVYEDRSFIFVTKTPPASDLLKRAAGIEKGSGTSGRDNVAKISHEKIREIAQMKLKDLNALDLADDPLRQLSQPDIHNRKDEALFAAVIAVDGAETHPRHLRHRADIGPVEIRFGEDFEGGLLQPLLDLRLENLVTVRGIHLWVGGSQCHSPT